MASGFLMRDDPHVVFQPRNDLSLSLYDLRETQELFTGCMVFPESLIVLLHREPAEVLHVFVGLDVFDFATAPDLSTRADGTGATAGVVSDEADWTELESGGESKGEEEV